METLTKEYHTKSKIYAEREKALEEFKEMPIPNKPASLSNVDFFLHSVSLIFYAIIFYILLSNF